MLRQDRGRSDKSLGSRVRNVCIDKVAEDRLPRRRASAIDGHRMASGLVIAGDGPAILRARCRFACRERNSGWTLKSDPSVPTLPLTSIGGAASTTAHFLVRVLFTGASRCHPVD